MTEAKKEKSPPIQPKDFIAEFHFDLDDWQNPEKAELIFGQFLTFTLALDQSRQSPIETLVGKNSIQDLFVKSKKCFKGGLSESENLSAGEELILDSHLFLPWMFPHVLRIMNQTGLLSDNGLKNLALQALLNKRVQVDEPTVLDLLGKTPTASFGSRRKTAAFLQFLADNFREAFSKTGATRHLCNLRREDFLPAKQELFTTQNPARQQEVLSSLRQWFSPKKAGRIPSFMEARLRIEQGSGAASPQEYIRDSRQRQRYSRTIYRVLKSSN